MTISSTTVKNSYSGDSSTTTFSYTFKIFADSDIQVIIRSSTGTETTKTITTHYTVTGAGNSGGGSVIFTSGNIPTTGQTVLLRRNIPQTQAIDYIANDPFPAESHEEGLDRSTMAIQQLQEEVTRAIKLSRTNTMTSTEFTVAAADRANKILAFDTNGEISVTQELGTFRGNWATATSYSGRDIVKDTSTNNIFIVNTAHTSSGTQPLTTNANSALYELLVDAASASTSANAAANHASNSSNFANNSSNSANTSANHSANSSNFANNSSNSANASAANAAGVSANANAAANSAANSSNFANNSSNSANSASNHSSNSSNFANNSSNSANTSANHASNSSNFANNSSNSANTSANHSANSSNFANNSSNSANTSANHASNSSNHASNSSNHSANSSNFANTSSNHAANSSNFSNNSSNFANTASNSANAANSARDAALAAADNFDDVYLGAKSSAPTLDNDGDALTAGDLYYNTVSGTLQVYSGSAWQAAAVSTAGFATLAGTETFTNKTLTLPIIDNIKIGYSTTATAAGTTTLTVSSNYKQYFTGSTTQTIVLPVVSTLTLGHTFEIHNNSSGSLTVNSSGSNLVGTINANTTATCTCILTTGTTAASWDFDLTGFTTALPITRGGTGLTALGTSLQSLRVNSGATALEFATASAGFSGANVNSISSSSITLTSASAQFQVAQIDSSTNNFVTLPDATTMSTKGSFVFVIENRSPIGGSIDIKNNSGTILFKLSANNVAFISLVDNSTSAGVWKIIEKNLQALVSIDTANATTTSYTNASRQRILPLSSTKFVLFHFYASGATGTVYTKVGDISGSSITFGSEQSTTITTPGHTDYVSYKFATIRLSDSSFLLHLGYTSVTGGGSGTAKNRLRVCTVSGTTVTFGAEANPSFPETVTADFTSMYYATGNGAICRMEDDKFAIIYNTAHDNTQWSGSLACKICTVSGTTITQGTAVNLGSSTFTFPSTVVCHDTDRLCVIYAQASTGVTTGRNKVNIISVSSTTPTWGTSVTVEASDVLVTGWGYTGDPFTQDTNSMYGVALSTTSVFGGVVGSHILISISGTTPTVVLKKAYSASVQGYVPPLKINSSTVFIYDYYYYITSTGFYASPAIVGTSNSTLLTFYSHKTSTEDTGILNFTFVGTTATVSQGTLNP